MATMPFVIETSSVLERGDIVLLRFTQRVPMQQAEAIGRQLREITNELGIRFVLLPDTVEVAQVKRRRGYRKQRA